MTTFSLISSIGQLILTLIVCGYTVYFVKDVTFRIKAQVDYEMEFLDRHEIIINQLQHLPPGSNEYMPLTFPNQQADDLLSLCQQCRSRWLMPNNYVNRCEPRIEVDFFRLRRLAVAGGLFKVEVIRCNDKYALIEAGDGLSAYVLETHEFNTEAGIPVFSLYGKFKYKQ